MQLCLEAHDEPAARAALAHAIRTSEMSGRGNLVALAKLWEETPGAFPLIKTITAREGKEPAAWAEVFDAAAKISPEASVALYSLGRRDLLSDATREVVELLDRYRLLGSDRIVLEIGCGIGRFVEALAPQVKQIVGLDISSGMLEEARRRCAGLPNVHLVKGNGRDFGFADRSFDLVLAIDTFPYLVASGEDVIERNMREAHRVLRSGGTLAIFNYSYRGAIEADRRDLAALARAIGLRIVRDSEQNLRLWDGALFQLERA